tara:strand:- start:318 stop:1259 length:942 start_codon:yes stop_codon:yes gene_type:complete
MTLVIAGHNLEFSSSIWHENDDIKEMHLNGLYVASDSAITRPTVNGKKTMLGGFRKIYQIPIKVFKPYFVGSDFRGYFEVYHESSCFVGIAGNTLTAQHILNSIFTHLSDLRISYENDEKNTQKIKYCIVRSCQKNNLIRTSGTTLWSEDAFVDRDFESLVTAQFISDIIEHSIQNAVNSAKQYKLDENDFKSLFTEFVAGIYCPVNKSHHLYTYRMDPYLNAEGCYDISIIKEEVNKETVAVLGMRNEYEKQAIQIVKDCIDKKENPSNKIFEFLNNAIDREREKGNGEIDRPSVIKSFIDGQLNVIYHTSK